MCYAHMSYISRGVGALVGMVRKRSGGAGGYTAWVQGACDVGVQRGQRRSKRD